MTATLEAADNEADPAAEQPAPAPASTTQTISANTSDGWETRRWRWAVDTGPWWSLSMLVSAILLVVLVSMWHAKNGEDLIDEAQLVDREAVGQKLQELATAGTRNAESPPIEIPTGVFVQSLRFESPSDVHITGYVWQRFPGVVEEEQLRGGVVTLIDDAGDSHDIVPGIILPDQVDSRFETEIRSILSGQMNSGTLRSDGREVQQTVTASTVPDPAPGSGGQFDVTPPGESRRTTPSSPPPETTPATTTSITTTTGPTMPEASFGRVQDVAAVEDPLQQDSADESRDAKNLSTTVLYYVEGPIRLNLNYRDYPFDHKIVALRVWPADFSANVVLTPDFDGYPCKRPGEVQSGLHCTSLKSTFGIDEDVVLGEFSRKDTYFSYHLEEYYNSNLGSDQFSQTNYPELQFNVLIRRNVIDGFVSDMLPVVIASGLAFGILMTLTGDRKRFGFNTTQVMTTLAGLFLAVLIAHQQLRREFIGVVYFEYFYFLMYLVLLGIGVLAILINVPAASSRTFFTFGNNLIPQILFWPSLLGASVAITWAVLFL